MFAAIVGVVVASIFSWILSLVTAFDFFFNC